MTSRTRERPRSAASRVFLVLLAAVLAIGGVTAAFLAWETQLTVRQESERITRSIARSLADAPVVLDALASGRPGSATSPLQRYVEEVRTGAELDFITVMDVDRVRLTHPDPARIGQTYVGTVPGDGKELTEEFAGTLGPSIRTIVPVRDAAGTVRGWVAAGVTIESISTTIARRLPLALGFAIVLVALGSIGAMFARRVTRRIAGDLPAGSVRDAVAAYESVRTLGEALRAQTHEHGNRLHTAISLLELDRKDEAIALLAESSAQSQSVIDQMTLRDGDPVLGALLLGKSSQAKERGIRWRVHLAPDAPPLPLAPVDAVAVVGNLIDNALDAAGQSDERWVAVDLLPGGEGATVLTVSDSGPGVPEHLIPQIFEHGFSTKPAEATGRGVGLSLVRSIVVSAGGTVSVSTAPSVFQVTLPARSVRRSG
ncbi:ATP-binding protein [Microbacterium capsulatum]|uniref:histidine kinase n=1 Tax=Microbacterium capsulatum TaxID=3041921 RepID=A0ABU0XKA0_9MICO|nr:ATP-binding protein [Microbacterium sp. ASV81]MDQ4215567.1 ATP-binding protein [Microbacterium sp. ASV81]